VEILATQNPTTEQRVVAGVTCNGPGGPGNLEGRARFEEYRHRGRGAKRDRTRAVDGDLENGTGAIKLLGRDPFQSIAERRVVFAGIHVGGLVRSDYGPARRDESL